MQKMKTIQFNLDRVRIIKIIIFFLLNEKRRDASHTGEILKYVSEIDVQVMHGPKYIGPTSQK